MKKKNVVAIVPARGGSKSIHYKNLKKIKNKPLIYFILKTLIQVKSIDRIIVSTEDIKIKKAVRKLFPKLEIIDRSKKLSTDRIALTEVVKHVAKAINNKDYKPDIVLQVAPTCPYIKKKTIEDIVKKLKNEQSDCVVTLKRIEHEHPYRAKELNKKTKVFKSFIKYMNVEKFISRQELPELYCTSGAIYGRTYDLLQKFKNKDFCLGKNPVGVVVDDIEATNIDRPIDFEFAKFLVKKIKK
jgi:CMP-N,N'-diacetyllegionaminic acid synthase